MSIKRYLSSLFFSIVVSLVLSSGKKAEAQPAVQSLEERLTFEVKNIEDFIDRFNFMDGNDFLKFYRQKYPEQRLSRADVVKTLFSKVNGNYPIDENSVNTFVRFVTNPAKPYWLNFYYPGWYALVDCSFERMGEMVNVKLTLEIESDTSYACKWVISGVNSSFTLIPNVRNSAKSLNPVSYNTNFMALDQILNDKKNLVSYMNSNFKPSALSIFINELKTGKLKFIQVNSVKYYFLQVPDWGFEVKYFADPSPIPGWIISNIFMMTDKEKEYFVIKNLGIQ